LAAAVGNSGIVCACQAAAGKRAIISVQAGMPTNIKIAHTSWNRLIG
jgi:hypothetical protein